MGTDGVTTVDGVKALKEIVEPLKKETVYY
jgi:hypothetical protein